MHHIRPQCMGSWCARCDPVYFDVQYLKAKYLKDDHVRHHGKLFYFIQYCNSVCVTSVAPERSTCVRIWGFRSHEHITVQGADGVRRPFRLVVPKQ